MSNPTEHMVTAARLPQRLKELQGVKVTTQPIGRGFVARVSIDHLPDGDSKNPPPPDDPAAVAWLKELGVALAGVAASVLGEKLFGGEKHSCVTKTTTTETKSADGSVTKTTTVETSCTAA